MKNRKTNNIILRLQEKLESIELDKDVQKLHERNDSTGTYYLFDTLTSKTGNITLRIGFLSTR
ncbi:hypothetical protein SEUBUCD646_0L04610 [Saccharomyces eubayanus]|nr:hypothetical protein SEUBUCD646_0L04610 [Saccharomyces eubayanus]